jgi:carbon-monoxide dehydrogenase medium subunit
MIPPGFDYTVASSLEEAIGALRDGGEDAKLLAGGHSLLPLMKLRLAAPTLLVDLRRVEELRGVSSDGDSIRFGAMTRHHEAATGNYGLVSAAAATIADQQVRNMGTVGGTMAHGDPASDLPAILLAAEGSVTIRGAGGEREVAAADFYEDYLTTAVGEGEILTAVTFPKLSGYGYGYQKFNRRQEDWAMVAVSALVKRNGDGSIEDARIGLTHMGSTPLRATAVEEALKGGASIAEASEHAADGTEPPADLNASQDYKRHLARVLCRRALEAASQ